MANKRKNYLGNVVTMISWEALVEAELAGEGHEEVDIFWEDEVTEALDEEAHWNWVEYDNPLEVYHMRVLHR